MELRQMAAEEMRRAVIGQLPACLPHCVNAHMLAAAGWSAFYYALVVIIIIIIITRRAPSTTHTSAKTNNPL